MPELDHIQKEEMDKDERWANYTPVPEKEMDHVSYKLTVCEMLREIYNKTKDPEIKMTCRIATSLAKSMAARITIHEGSGWGKKQYAWNPKLRHQRMRNKYEGFDSNLGSGQSQDSKKTD